MRISQNNYSSPQILQNGFTIYFALLVISIGLAISIGIADIFILETQIVRTFLPSVKSFFAADAGTECGLFWDLDQNVFDPIFPPAVVRCNAGNRLVQFSTSGGADPIDYFKFQYNLAADSCAIVEVAKGKDPLFVKTCTRITSRGVDRSCGVSFTGAVERAIVVRDPESCRLHDE